MFEHWFSPLGTMEERKKGRGGRARETGGKRKRREEKDAVSESIRSLGVGRGRGTRIREFYFFPGLENRFVDRSRECSLTCLNELKSCFFFFLRRRRGGNHMLSRACVSSNFVDSSKFSFLFSS